MEDHMHRGWLMGLATLLAGWLTASTASAQTFSDKATGLAVTPPPGYSAHAAPPRARYAVTVEIRRANDVPICKVGFQFVAANEKRSQTELNATAGTPERAEQLRQTLGAAFEVKEITPFEHTDVRGLAALGVMKLPGLAPEDQPRTVIIMMDTPKGRTTVSCAAFLAELTKRRGEFEALARGVTLPR
jgi:hypothetical protein